MSLRFLLHTTRLLLRCTEGILLVYLVAFIDLIAAVNCVLQFFFLIAMTWANKVNELILIYCGWLALYIGGSVGADDHRHQKLPFAESWTSCFRCLGSKSKHEWDLEAETKIFQYTCCCFDCSGFLSLCLFLLLTNILGCGGPRKLPCG